MSTTAHPVVVVGAGLAGLACARSLHRSGRPVLVLEASNDVGGRVRTDRLDGYRLDRGFQVLLTAYPEARSQLDLADLDLRPFQPGALVRCEGRWHRVADPFRQPIRGLAGLAHPIGTLGDKLRVGRLRLQPSRLARYRPEISALEALRAEGFSDLMIDRFFRPFFGGVFLETALETTVLKLAQTFRFFAAGPAAVPRHGMEAIPRQMRAELPSSMFRFNTRASRVEPRQVHLENDEQVQAAAVVLATDAGEASRLLGTPVSTPEFTRVSCLYYAASSDPFGEPILGLNGEGRGPINNLAVLSAAAPEYAPPGQHLVSISVVGKEEYPATDLATAVEKQLREWFGPVTSNWRHLRTYRIDPATPFQTRDPDESARGPGGVYRCGDYCGLGSINSALGSGRLAAKAVLEDLREGAPAVS